MFEWRDGPLIEKVVVELIGEIELRPPGAVEAKGSEDEDVLLVVVVIALKGLVGI
jgi:hypothetical protein